MIFSNRKSDIYRKVFLKPDLTLGVDLLLIDFDLSELWFVFLINGAIFIAFHYHARVENTLYDNSKLILIWGIFKNKLDEKSIHFQTRPEG